ncbi:uncharacterized protein [Coffea arabica]|uniref:Uncharacterized protein n=1 Tax=Coffea arabica TaxID=13443 RepID=A0ABM4W5G6_COFAR
MELVNNLSRFPNYQILQALLHQLLLTIVLMLQNFMQIHLLRELMAVSTQLPLLILNYLHATVNMTMLLGFKCAPSLLPSMHIKIIFEIRTFRRFPMPLYMIMVHA